jgi:hypothetical protein
VTNKQIMISLLQDALRASKKYVLFTVIKKEGNHPAVFQANRFLYYSHEELVDILNLLGVKNYTITCNEDIDSNEWFVLCKPNIPKYGETSTNTSGFHTYST